MAEYEKKVRNILSQNGCSFVLKLINNCIYLETFVLGEQSRKKGCR